MIFARKALVAAVILLLVPAVAPAQQVFKEISSDKLEEILKGMNITFNKGGNGKTPPTTWFDYKSKDHQIRLWNYNGKDLMLDVLLPKVPWEEVNKWNGTAKFSRARLDANNTILEYNLDVMGGVTEDTIKHYIREFDKEVERWNRTVAKGGPGPGPGGKDSTPPVKDGNPPAPGGKIIVEEIYNKVTADKLERVLNGLKVKFKKQQGKGTNMIYDYEKDGFKIRIVNFGGDDLMIDATFPQAPLAKINGWNEKRNFIRAVNYGGANPYTSLESNLDCVAGTSDSIIRYFITSFDLELKEFDKHLKAN